MRRSVIAVVLAVTWAARSLVGAGECAGDLNGDGTVTINEIISAVNAALDGCAMDPCPGDLNGDHVVTVDEIIKAVSAALAGCDATPTPTPVAVGCPYSFQDDTSSLGVSCGYSGPFSSNPTCSTDLSALVLGDGHLVAVSVGSDPLITFGGVVTSATAATMVTYFIGDDETSQPLSGVMELQDGGATLIVDPETVPAFNIGGAGCTFDRYAGTFTRSVGNQARRTIRK